ncbi:MAG: HAD-IA family hydrolase [Candidatus Sulfopaludibacter sp.]|nr:HAD-IA family hydrolase [Candidatus Sulfopaludibacter sp.]
MIPRFPIYLFDIDGTLLDSARDICGAIQQVLEATDLAPVSFEFLKGYIGLHLLDLFQDLFPQYTPEQYDELIRQYRVFYLAREHKLTQIYPGVAEGLAALGGRKSTATTKGSPTTRLILEQFGLLRYFEHVQGTDGFPCKPAPDVIFTALAALGAKPEDCLFVGDSPADMEAGRRAGVKTCAVRYGYGKDEEMARFTPDYWIDDLRALVNG